MNPLSPEAMGGTRRTANIGKIDGQAKSDHRSTRVGQAFQPDTLLRRKNNRLESLTCAARRLLRVHVASGSASEAGARPGLQNRGCDAANHISHKKLRNHTPSLTAQGQRAESNDPRLAAIVKAWETLPEGVRQSMAMLVKAASGE
jgi:hypothetical protein